MYIFATMITSVIVSLLSLYLNIPAPNGLCYWRWGGDGEAVQLEKS